MKRLIPLIAVLILLLACQPSPVAPGTTTTTSQVPTTIPTNTDATAALQAALNASKYLYVDKNYIVNGTISPPNGSQIVFGPQGRFTRTSEAPVIGTLPVLLLEKGNVVIRNPRISGPNPCYWTYFDTSYTYSQYDPKREWNHAISIMGGSTYLIDNPVINNMWGDAINIDRNPSNITINNLQANCVGRSIISNTGSTDVIVNGGRSSGAFWWTFNMEPFGDRVVRNYTVKNFTIGFSRAESIFASGPYFNCQIYNAQFSGLTYLVNRGTKINTCVSSQIIIKP